MKSIQQEDTIAMMKRQLENHEVRVQHLEKMQPSTIDGTQINGKNSVPNNSKRGKRSAVRVLSINPKKYLPFTISNVILAIDVFLVNIL